MINISNPADATRYDKYIKALHDEFGSRLFTRKEFEEWRMKFAVRTPYGKYRSKTPCLETFLNSHIIHVENKENFSRAYVTDRWYDKEFINTAELKKLREMIENCASETLAQYLNEALDDNVNEMDSLLEVKKKKEDDKKPKIVLKSNTNPNLPKKVAKK